MMANSPGSSRGSKKKRRTHRGSDTKSETEDGCLNKEDICQKCDKRVKSQDNALQCEKCNMWHHCGCVGVSKKAYECLTELETTMWFCKMCFSKLRQEKEDLKAMQEDVKQIKEDVGCIKSTLSSGYVTPATEVRHAVKQSPESFTNELEDKLQEIIVERDEREKRKLNLIVHGLTETWPDGEPIDDGEAFKALCKDTLKIPDVIVTGTLRLGPKNPPARGRGTGGTEDAPDRSRPWIRPLKVVVSDVDVKYKILKASPELRNLKARIYITPDKTIKQREHDRQLRVQCSKFNEEHQGDDTEAYIKQGKMAFRPRKMARCAE